MLDDNVYYSDVMAQKAAQAAKLAHRIQKLQAECSDTLELGKKQQEYIHTLLVEYYKLIDDILGCASELQNN